jgi:rubrerythrin
MSQQGTNTGASDKTFNLVSVLYHALEAASTHQQYVSDAEQNGDTELADFFREIQQHHQQMAERAKGLLKQRLG